MFSQHAEMALACIKDAEAVIAQEFELDRTTNTFAKSPPEWVARLSQLLNAAHGNLLNAKESGN